MFFTRLELGSIIEDLGIFLSEPLLKMAFLAPLFYVDWQKKLVVFIFFFRRYVPEMEFSSWTLRIVAYLEVNTDAGELL